MERIYQIDQILGDRRFVTRKELQERLGVSWATLKRDLNYLKDRLNAPIALAPNQRQTDAPERNAHYTPTISAVSVARC